MLRSRRLWVGLAVSLLFLALFFYRLDYSSLGRSFLEADYIYLLPAFMIYLGAIWFRAVRWRYLLAPLKAITSRRLFPVVVIGYTANNLLPMRLGEFVRSYFLGEREKVSMTSALGTIVVERTFDGLALLFLLALLLLANSLSSLIPVPSWLVAPMPSWAEDLVRVTAVLFLGALLALVVIIASPARTERVLDFVLRFLPGRFRDRAPETVRLLVQGLRVFQHPGRFLVILAASELIWFTEAAMYFVITYAFDFNLSLAGVLFLTAVANLAITVPSSQGGIGPFEYFGRQSLMLFGVAPAVAGAYIIVLHAWLMVPLTLLGLGYLWREHVSLSKMAFPGPKGPAVPSACEGDR